MALAICYFLFSSEKEKETEDLTFKSLLTYVIVITACSVLTGFLGMIIHGVGQNWLGILLSILVMLLPVAIIIRSLRKDGLPLGNREEWTSHFSSSSSSSSRSRDPSRDSDGVQRTRRPVGEEPRRYTAYDVSSKLSRVKSAGWVWARDVNVSEMGENEFSIMSISISLATKPLTNRWQSRFLMARNTCCVRWRAFSTIWALAIASTQAVTIIDLAKSIR